jgi:hypothetical protein
MLLAADIPAHIAKAPVPAGCAQRVEGIVIDANGTRAVQALPANPANDVIRGPFYLGGAKHPRTSGDGPQRSAKLPAFLGTGHTATLTVDAAHRDWAQLHFGATSASVSFTACPPDTARLDHKGTVGPITMWAGGVQTRGAHCVRLHLSVDGRPQRDIRLPLGRACH